MAIEVQEFSVAARLRSASENPARRLKNPSADRHETALRCAEPEAGVIESGARANGARDAGCEFAETRLKAPATCAHRERAFAVRDCIRHKRRSQRGSFRHIVTSGADMTRT